MRRITFFLLGVFVVLATQARLVDVLTTSEYAAAYNGAIDGDTLVLRNGTYNDNLGWPAAKSVTVMAPDTCDVYINWNSAKIGVSSLDSDLTGGSLEFINVKFTQTVQYLISGQFSGAFERLRFTNCEIANIGRCILRLGNSPVSTDTKTYQPAVINNIEFDNCIFHNCGYNGWALIYSNSNNAPVTPMLNVKITDCTMYDMGKSEGFLKFKKVGEAVNEESVNFVFTHNTMFTAQRGLTDAICKLDDTVNGTEGHVVFQDNIVVCPDTATTTGSHLFRARAGYFEQAEFKNNLTHGYVLYATGDTLIEMDAIADVTDENNWTFDNYEGMTAENIFPNASLGDFTVYSVSPLATAASDGGVLGARRWLKTVGALYTLTRELGPGVDAAAGTVTGSMGQVPAGEEITLTATKNFGYKFVKWVDAAGNLLSEEGTYTFTMDSDKTIYAIFETVPVYKLTINIEGGAGGGSVAVSEKGKDGEYSYYEEGAELILNVKTNAITEFAYWADIFTAEMSRTVVMTSDMDITAVFAAPAFLCGFDFDTNRNSATTNRPADYVSTDYPDKENVPVMNMYYSYTTEQNGGTETATGFRLREESGRYYVCPWQRYTAAGGTGEYKLEDGSFDFSKYITGYCYYFTTCLNTTATTFDVVVKYSMRTNYYGYDDMKLQYSYNNLSWETVNTVSLASSWQDYCDTIPNSAGKETLYVRFYPDVTSTPHNNINDVDATHYTDIFFLLDDPAGIQNTESTFQPVVKVENGMLNVKSEGINEVKLYSVDGKLVRSGVESSNFVWNVASLKGVYVLNIGGHVTKVLF